MTYSPQSLGIVTLGLSQASKFLSADSSGDLIMPDSDKIEFGSDSDMTMYHDDTNAYITNSKGALKIADQSSGIAISIGHTTSEVTVNDNLTVTGDLTVNGTTTSINQAYIDVTNAFVFEGASANAHETTLGIVDPTADATINLPAMAAGTYYLPVLAAASTTSITSTPAELNILDGVTATATELNYLDITTLGTAAASKALTWASDSTWTAAGGTCANLGTVTTVDINGGTIDGAVIGGASTAAGSFAALAATTGTFSGILKPDDNTDATSTTDGSLQTDGGLSVVKDCIFGNDVKLLTDSSVFAMGVDSDFTITHDNATGATIATGAKGLAISAPAVTVSSSAASSPILHITNTHAGATSGELRFNKDSASGADSDIMGLISFYGTDDSDNTHERLAYVDAIITDSAHGSEAASLRFYVAENDATLTAGLGIAGQADADGEVDVTIGAGAASTATVAGSLTVTGDIILDDGGSLKEAGGTAAITFDGSGNVTKIGQDSPSSGEFLKFDGTNWVAASATVSGLACDDLSVGDAAVTVSTSVGNITIETQANDTDIIFNVDDGGSQITALTLDGSDDGAAIFKSKVTAGTHFVEGVENASSSGAISKGFTGVTPSSSNLPMTLPPSAGNSTTTGRKFTIKKVDSGSGNVTVTTATNDKVDGGDSIILYHQFESVTVVDAGTAAGDGFNYYIM